MKPQPTRKSSPDLSKTRTGSDWVMIVLGIFLVTLFLVAGFFSYVPTDTGSTAKPRGPVKDPKTLRPESSTGELNMPFRIASGMAARPWNA